MDEDFLFFERAVAQSSTLVASHTCTPTTKPNISAN